MAQAISLMAPAALGSSCASSHEPFHAVLSEHGKSRCHCGRHLARLRFADCAWPKPSVRRAAHITVNSGPNERRTAQAKPRRHQAHAARNSLQHDGYEPLEDQLITQHTGRAENPLAVKSV